MKKNIDRLAFAVLAAALLCAPPRARAAVRPNAASSPAGTVPSAVNYQGRLVDNGFPVTGLRSVTFRLYNVATGGVALLPAIPPQTVSVDQGLFSTTLVLSTAALAGPQQKYLEVQVGTQVLSPREPLNSVPYALVAKSIEEDLSISSVSVGTQLVSSGTLSVASIQALAGSSYFAIISPVHMSSSVLTLDGNNATALTAVGNVGVGTANPGSKLNVSSGTVIVDGNAATALVLDNSAGLPVLRFRETGADKGAVKSVSGALVLDGDTAANRAILLNTNSTGNVGVGATIPGAKLDVDGDAQFGSPGTKSAFATTGALTMASGASAVLSGANGFVTSGSSINAASFWGNGANLTNVPAVSVPAAGVTAGTFQNAAYTFQNAVNFPGPGVWNAAGSAGVGTAAPATKLDVNGSAQFGSGATKSTFTAAGALQLASSLATLYGGTGQNFSAAPLNNVPFFSAAGTMGLIAAGGNAQVLRVPTAGGAPAFGAVDLGQGNATVNQLLTSRGGTGQDWSAVAQGALPYFSAAGTMAPLSAGTVGQVLQTNGAGFNPSWAAPSIGGASTLTNGKIWIGSVLNLAAEQSVSGNASLTNAGVLSITSLPAISGAALTSLTAANISAGTAGIGISGNAATASALAAAPTACTLPNVALGIGTNGNASCSPPSNVTGNAASATIGSGFTSLTLAGIQGVTPTAVGQVYYCSNCATTPVCVSTGTTLASFSGFATKATLCQ